MGFSGRPALAVSETAPAKTVNHTQTPPGVARLSLPCATGGDPRWHP